MREKRQRAEKRLRVHELDKLPPGWHEDGGGLRFVVLDTGRRRWVQRITVNGRRVNRGLGPYPLVSLDAARDASIDMRRAARLGKDTRQQRQATFREAFEQHWAQRKQGLKNKHHKWQWEAGMTNHAFPRIGDRAVAEVTHDEIVAVLRPIWRETPETARRLLQRINIIFKVAISRGLRERANPCEGVAEDLGKQGDRVTHHPALPWQGVSVFLQQLRSSSAHPVTKLAFEFLILTATRSGEVRHADWSEIEGDRWVIPAERMKGGLEHVVPLSPRVQEILGAVGGADQSAAPTGLLFPNRRGKPLSDMAFTQLLRRMGLGERASAHGFRSTFRDWATEHDKCREVVAEAALAHVVKGKVEAAYRRTSYLDERITLMQRWADFCAEPRS